jgi:hypothetical protein
VRGKKSKSKTKSAKIVPRKKDKKGDTTNPKKQKHPSSVTPAAQSEESDHVVTTTVDINLISWESKRLAYFHLYNAWTSALTLASLGPSLKGGVGINSQAEAMELCEWWRWF